MDEGAILDAVFEKFHHTPPSGFERIMIEKTVLWERRSGSGQFFSDPGEFHYTLSSIQILENILEKTEGQFMQDPY